MSDTTLRDQLAQIIWDCKDLNRAVLADCEDIADRILEAGWRLTDPDSQPEEGESADAPTSAILRYEVRIDDTAQSVPAGEVVLVHAHRQGLVNRLEVWIKVADGELRTQTLRVFGTGQEIQTEWRPLGSCVAGPFVWHLCGGE